MIVRRPSQIEGIYCLRMENMIRDSVRNRLNEARSSDECHTIRGDAAEDVAKRLLPDIGFGKAIDHPLPNTERRKGCRRKGPDLLVQDLRTGQWFYVEVKWWQDATKATRRAIQEVLAHLATYPKLNEV